MLSRDVGGNCETESGTVFFRCEERLEDALLRLGRDTAALVTNLDTKAIRFEEAPDENYAAGGSCLDSIEDQVEQKLLDLLGIAADLAQGLLLKLKRDVARRGCMLCKNGNGLHQSCRFNSLKTRETGTREVE